MELLACISPKQFISGSLLESRIIQIYTPDCIRVGAQSFQLFATLWTITHQAPLSMGFPRQEYWSGLPFSPSGDLPHSSIEPSSPASPALASRFFTTEPPGKPIYLIGALLKYVKFLFFEKFLLIKAFFIKIFDCQDTKTCEWCDIYTEYMEYYSVKKRTKFCICSNMDGLGNSMLSRIIQREKDKYCKTLPICRI